MSENLRQRLAQHRNANLDWARELFLREGPGERDVIAAFEQGKLEPLAAYIDRHGTIGDAVALAIRSMIRGERSPGGVRLEIKAPRGTHLKPSLEQLLYERFGRDHDEIKASRRVVQLQRRAIQERTKLDLDSAFRQVAGEMSLSEHQVERLATKENRETAAEHMRNFAARKRESRIK